MSTIDYYEKKIDTNMLCENCGKRKATWDLDGFKVCGYCKAAHTRFINRLLKK